MYNDAPEVTIQFTIDIVPTTTSMICEMIWKEYKWNIVQDLYLNILRKRGQIVTQADGSNVIVSYPQVGVVL